MASYEQPHYQTQYAQQYLPPSPPATRSRGNSTASARYTPETYQPRPQHSPPSHQQSPGYPYPYGLPTSRVSPTTPMSSYRGYQTLLPNNKHLPSTPSTPTAPPPDRPTPLATPTHTHQHVRSTKRTKDDTAIAPSARASPTTRTARTRAIGRVTLRMTGANGTGIRTSMSMSMRIIIMIRERGRIDGIVSTMGSR
ncbi:hypothetical protein LTR87_007896 [Friedmanniomyces endolithicus]|nr:hypothetical protein LTR87_007896 [Friedmanniomyces endolithicus]